MAVFKVWEAVCVPKFPGGGTLSDWVKLQSGAALQVWSQICRQVQSK